MGVSDAWHPCRYDGGGDAPGCAGVEPWMLQTMAAGRARPEPVMGGMMQGIHAAYVREQCRCSVAEEPPIQADMATPLAACM